MLQRFSGPSHYKYVLLLLLLLLLPYLDVPVHVDDEVSCVKKFALVSGICHSGSLHSGHYTAFARDDACVSWLHLNDKAVTRTTLKALNGPLTYVLFYFILFFNFFYLTTLIVC